MTLLQFLHEHYFFAGFVVFWVVVGTVDVAQHLSKIGRQTIVHHHHGLQCREKHEEGPCRSSDISSTS